MHVLVTRPIQDSFEIILELKKRSYDFTHIPLLKIDYLDVKEINLKDYEIAIFTSANAVRSIQEHVQKNKKIKCYCVGRFTEKVAKNFGFLNTISAEGSVNALKNLIINSEKNNNLKKIIYLCGDHTSFDLEKELKAEGLKINKVVTYSSKVISEVDKESIKKIKEHLPDVIFIYSSRGAEGLIKIVEKYSLYQLLKESVVACMSNKIVEYFKNNKWKKIDKFNPGEELIKIEQLKK
ncbi:MAG: uroporphyrinogen-III synthase [Pelagibacteraceae bacterium]|nr:uroporphyrinogen-III synthase [Pelagibacteraceae bacterium]MBO6485372.1 uroporphyrinogen-III synthase [Pelagibacteraceae bacterium]